jgi:hypothetical protein
MVTGRGARRGPRARGDPCNHLRGVAMRTDEDIKRDVENELKRNCGHAVRFRAQLSQRRRAEEDAARVRGVKGVANDLEVQLPLINKPPDPIRWSCASGPLVGRTRGSRAGRMACSRCDEGRRPDHHRVLTGYWRRGGSPAYRASVAVRVSMPNRARAWRRPSDFGQAPAGRRSGLTGANGSMD